MKSVKVAVTGPEGSGKSLLARAISSYYKGHLIEDHIEFYLEKHREDHAISETDIKTLAEAKVKLVQSAVNDDHNLIVSDGELLILKIWSEFKFNEYADFLQEQLTKQNYDLYILTSPEDIPRYEFRREDPSLRKYFFNAFKKELDSRNWPYLIAEGDFYTRKKEAVQAINKLLKSN